MQCKMAPRKKNARKKNNQVKNGAKPFEKRAQKNVISPCGYLLEPMDNGCNK